MEKSDKQLEAQDKTTTVGEKSCSDKDIDVNMPNISIIAEHYAKLKLETEKKGKMSELLDKARLKYHFNDPDTPSFRLFEDVDDRGKSIEEPELWRPLGMNDDDYEKKIELEKLKAHQHAMNNSDIKDFQTPRSFLRDNNKLIDYESEYKTIVQCAQKDPGITGLTESPRHKLETKPSHSIIDLSSPVAVINSHGHVPFDRSYTNQSRPEYNQAQLIGRKLFEDVTDDYTATFNNFTERNKKHSDVNESPEVEILGEKVFKDTCNNMSKQIDNLYNTQLSLGSSNSAKENFFPQRVVAPSKYACSPYDMQGTNYVSLAHQQVYDAITKLCDMDKYKFDWAIKIDNIKVSMDQLGNSMKPDGWVEAWLINAYCRKLFRDKHPKQSQKHYFFNTATDYFLEKYKNEKARLEWREKTINSFIGAGKARPLHLSERLYFPSVYELHWFVFVVDIKGHNFIFLDSLHGEDSSYHKKASKKLITGFVNT